MMWDGDMINYPTFRDLLIDSLIELGDRSGYRPMVSRNILQKIQIYYVHRVSIHDSISCRRASGKGEQRSDLQASLYQSRRQDHKRQDERQENRREEENDKNLTPALISEMIRVRQFNAFALHALQTVTSGARGR